MGIITFLYLFSRANSRDLFKVFSFKKTPPASAHFVGCPRASFHKNNNNKIKIICQSVRDNCCRVWFCPSGPDTREHWSYFKQNQDKQQEICFWHDFVKDISWYIKENLNKLNISNNLECYRCTLPLPYSLMKDFAPLLDHIYCSKKFTTVKFNFLKSCTTN